MFELIIYGTDDKYLTQDYSTIICDDICFAMDTADAIVAKMKNDVFVYERGDEPFDPNDWDKEPVYTVSYIDEDWHAVQQRYEEDVMEEFNRPLTWTTVDDMVEEFKPRFVDGPEDESDLRLIMI